MTYNWDEDELEWNEDFHSWICEEKKIILSGKEIRRLTTTTGTIFYLFNGRGPDDILYEDVEIAFITKIKYYSLEPGVWEVQFAKNLGEDTNIIYIEIPNSEKRITLSYFKRSEAIKQAERWLPKVTKGTLAQDPGFKQFLRDYLLTKEGKFLSKIVKSWEFFNFLRLYLSFDWYFY